MIEPLNTWTLSDALMVAALLLFLLGISIPQKGNNNEQ